jgi:pimeloyl-ACP methyl ester carboxylesterase
MSQDQPYSPPCTIKGFILKFAGGGALVIALLSPAVLFGDSYTWTNFNGGSWSFAKNWSPNGVPGPNDYAFTHTNELGPYTVTYGGTLVLGVSSNGSLVIGRGVSFSSSGGAIGSSLAGSNSGAGISGTWQTGNLLIGDQGSQNGLGIGGSVSCASATIGHNASANRNSVVVQSALPSGTGATWNITGQLVVGDQGSQNKLCIDGGSVRCGSATIGRSVSANDNSVLIDQSGCDPNSAFGGSWDIAGALIIGDAGSRNRLIGSVNCDSATIGRSMSSTNNFVSLAGTITGSLIVGGAGSGNSLEAYELTSGSLIVGKTGSGNSLAVGHIMSVSAIIGDNSSNNWVSINHTPGWENTGGLVVGNLGSYNSLSVGNADLSSGSTTVGAASDRNYVLFWDSDLIINGDLCIGSAGSANQAFFNGTEVSCSGSIIVGRSGTRNELLIGYGGRRSGFFRSGPAVIGVTPDAAGNLVDLDVQWDIDGSLSLGAAGASNQLTLYLGGRVNATDFIQGDTSTLHIEVGSALIDNGHLHLTGNANFAGTVEIGVQDPGSFQAGDEIPIISYGSHSGQFARLAGHVELHDGLILYPDYRSTGLVLVVTAPVSITLHRLTEPALIVSQSDGIDDPLQIRSDPGVLSIQPEVGRDTTQAGLVADGVTPLLMKLSLRDAPVTPLTNRIVFTWSGGSVTNGDLNSRLWVLGPTGWQNTNAIVFTSSNGFAYLAPIESEELSIDQTELAVTMTLSRASSAQAEGKKEFKIKKPPVVLVHGYNADKSSWGPWFTAFFALGRSTNFVIAIDYGVNSAGPWWAPNSVYYPNTYERLDLLAKKLDGILRATIEEQNSGLHSNWAFTRYDIVGHSQGGVLTRLLCSKNSGNAFAPFRSANNYLRGRFHRVITIGSPHNGSTLVYYLLSLKYTEAIIGIPFLPKVLRPIIQDKFDPFGRQIQEINDPGGKYQVDTNADFHLVRATIASGYPPGPGHCPQAHSLIGLCNFVNIPGSTITRGEAVLPRGSDGIVDFDSQVAGNQGRMNVTPLLGFDITHADAFGFLFGVGAGESETTDSRVASVVRNLLDGSDSDFGPFILPTRLYDSRPIDRVLVPIAVDAIRRQQPFQLSAGVSATSTHKLIFEPLDSEPIEGSVHWFAEVFGPEGISADGIVVDVDVNYSTSVTVHVDDAVVGDVVLYANYSSLNGTVVFAVPVLVVSHAPGMELTSLEVVPSGIRLGPGDKIDLELWGTYDNSVRSLLFTLSDNNFRISSSNPSVLQVNTNGTLTAVSNGVATVTANYRGLSAEAVFSVCNPLTVAPPEFVSSTLLPDGRIQVQIIATPGCTYLFQRSDDLKTWKPGSRITATNDLITFSGTIDSQITARFFRLVVE